MIDVAAAFLVRELNAYMLARTGTAFGSAALSRIVADSGKYAIPDDQVGVALVSVEEERALRSQLPQSVYADGRQVVLEPDLKLNLNLLFAANFKQYDQGLRQLSLVLAFFQSHGVFTRERNPALDPRIERLGVDLVSLTFEQLNQLWAFVGAKQLPSVVYRVRLVVVQDLQPSGVQPPITTIGSTVEAI
jgi:uncharacterized protein DUF4255